MRKWLKVIVGFALLLGAGQVSAKCVQAGGTDANCEIAPVVWYASTVESKHPYRYATLDAAIHGVGSYLATTCAKCKSGILWAPLAGQPTNYYTHPDDDLASSATKWTVFVYGSEYDASGKFLRYVVSTNLNGIIVQEPRCGGRYAEQQVGVDGRRRWYCVSNSSAYAQAENIIDGVSGLDTTTEGCTTGCNPVNLVTGSKYDQRVDYKNYSPYPIVWKRWYNSRREQWNFNYTQRLSFDPSSGTTHVTLSRPDGAIIVLNTSSLSSTSAPSVWTPTMGTNKSWRGKLVDIRNTQGQLQAWEYTNLSDEVERYNVEGQLQYVQSPKGERITLRYTNEVLTALEDDYGRTLTLNYTNAPQQGSFVYEDPTVPNGQPPQTLTKDYTYFNSFLSSQSRPQVQSVSDGVQTVSYTYVNTGNSRLFLNHIQTVTHPDGSKLQYGYDSKGRLTSITDETANLYATYTYDSYNRVSKSVHGANQNPITYTYSSSYTRVKDGKNNEAQFSIADALSKKINKNSGSTVPCTKCAGTKAKTISYNDFGDPLNVVDFENVSTQYTYDTTRGLPLTTTEAAGTPSERTIAYTWHPTLRKPLTVTEPTWVNGAAHTRTTTFVYNTVGDPLNMTVSTSSGEPPRTWSYTYTPDLWLDTQTDPNGMVTKFTYDAQGNLTSKTTAFGTTHAQVTTFGGYSPKGLPGWSKDPNGTITRSLWNTRDQLEMVQIGVPSGADVWGSGQWETRSFEYTLWGALKTVTDSSGRSQNYVYDTAHRLTEVVEKTTNGTQHAKTVYTYDLANNIIKEEMFDASNAVVLEHTQTFDTVNRVKTVVDAHAKATTFDYTNEDTLKKITTPLANQTQYGFDALQRPILLTDALSNQFTTTYDAQNNIQTAKDARNTTTTYSYNGFGDLLRIISPDRGEWNFQYNAAGQRTHTIDPRGVVSLTTYDLLSRPTQVTFTSSSTIPGLDNTSQLRSFVYDSCAQGKGRLCSYSDENGSTSLTYDAWGRVTSQTWNGKVGSLVAGATLHTQYAYSPEGVLTAITYPSGRVLNIGHTNGYPSSLTFNNQHILHSAQWTAWGEVKQWTWGSASLANKNVVFNYDKNGQPYSIVDHDTKTYTLDDDQRITAITDNLNTITNQTYAYNKLNQVVQNSFGGAPHVYTYDTNGNLSSLRNNGEGFNFTTALNSNRLVGQSPVSGSVVGKTVSWTYDAMGSVLQDGQGVYTYNRTGNMSASSRGAFAAQYGYNALGQRVFKASSNTVEIYAHDPQGRRIGSYILDLTQPNGVAVQDEILYWDSWRIVGVARNNTVHPVLSDHLGTPRKILDLNGSVVWSWDGKDAYGFQAPNENAGGSLFEFNARFPGQWFDKESALIHNGFRYYNPTVGRYTQSDPLGLEAGWNTYAYVSGNPVSAVDYLGLVSKFVPYTKETKPAYYKNRDVKYTVNLSSGEAKYELGYITTNKGNNVEVSRLISGPELASQNCHGYALGLNYWIQDPTAIYKDEYEEVEYSKSTHTFFRSRFNQVPKHSGLNNQYNNSSDLSFGKWGFTETKVDNQKKLEIIYSPTYYRKK